LMMIVVDPFPDRRRRLELIHPAAVRDEAVDEILDDRCEDRGDHGTTYHLRREAECGHGGEPDGNGDPEQQERVLHRAAKHGGVVLLAHACLRDARYPATATVLAAASPSASHHWSCAIAAICSLVAVLQNLLSGAR